MDLLLFSQQGISDEGIWYERMVVLLVSGDEFENGEILDLQSKGWYPTQMVLW